MGSLPPSGPMSSGCFRGSIQRLIGVTVRIERVDDLPPKRSWMRPAAALRHTRVILPMKFGGAVTGLLTFATTERERAWPPDLVVRFEFVARLFASALGRER